MGLIKEKPRRTSMQAKFVLSISILLLCEPAHSQQDRQRRVGFIGNGGVTQSTAPYMDCFRSAQKKLGWNEGENITTIYKWANGNAGIIPQLVKELKDANVEVIATGGTLVTQNVAELVKDTPIVFAAVSDPVSSKIVTSASRPTGNITGQSNNLSATSRKILEYIKNINPSVKHMALLRNPNNDGKLIEENEIMNSAVDVGINIVKVDLVTAKDKDAAFEKIRLSMPDALLVLHDFAALELKKALSDFAIENRIIAAAQLKEYATSGALLSYGLNYCRHFERVSGYVDKILRGAKPVDLPVEYPSSFELVLNLRTAEALKLTIPASTLTQADELIE
ncbi:ABC transporter substrate-binding protein [Methylobacterium longum]|uniref:ABC transporter substrate-binding protein n=1 Tax=Methylobacterium longum TaxID=767694 RepID=A0ABT8ANV0_9HYPH|nr:ABC transporter substrate-binding protein [Methylobacterium longum]MDN3571568.1 ABC transporter substrate-binding protein [Methylobacterium longum]